MCGLPQPSHGTTESSAASLLTGAAGLAFAPELRLTPLLRAFLSWQWVGAERPSLFSCTCRFKARSILLRLLCCGPGFPDMGYFILASLLSISHVVILGHMDGGCACFLFQHSGAVAYSVLFFVGSLPKEWETQGRMSLK